MKRNRARVINQTTKDCNNPDVNNNESKFDIDITSEELIRLTLKDRWYEQKDIAMVAEYLMNFHGYNFKQQFEVIGGLDHLKTFLNKPEYANVSQLSIFIIYNKGGNHWVTFCITHHENNIKILFKDSFGEPISDDIKNVIKGCFAKTIFKSHTKQEQFDGFSCGPFSLKNLEIILQGLKLDKGNFIKTFEKTEFCYQQDIEHIKQNFKDNLQKNLSQKLKRGIADLVQDKKYDDFKKYMNTLVDTYCTYADAHIPMEQYNKVMQEEINKQEEDANYTMDERVIEQAKRAFLENKQIKELMEQQTNTKQDTQKRDNYDFDPGVLEKFPEQMQTINTIFELLSNCQQDETLVNVLQDVSKMLAIDFDKIKKLFEFKLKKEHGIIQQEDVLEPKSLEKIKKDKLPCKSNPGPDASEKTLEQLLSELVSVSHTDEQSNDEIDPKFSPEELKQQYKNKYINSKEILQLEVSFNEVKAYYKYWQSKAEENILDWAKKKRNTFSEKDLYEAIAVMDRANELVTGGNRLRDTQILSVLIFLQLHEKKGVLCQISTGEGKTTIVSLVATLTVLQGKKVDVITSNQVLAEKGVKNRENFYGLFGISVAANNIDEAYRQGPKKCYSADIVYGSISNFQFDYLKHAFEGLETRDKRGFDFVILDEVDSMLVDNGGYIAKLAEPFPGMDSLKYVYIKIWQELHKAEEKLCEDFHQRLQNKAEGLRKKEGIPDTVLQDEFDKYTAELYTQKVDELKNNIRATNPSDIDLVPTHLKPYAKSMVDKWIDNAMYAKYQCKEYEQYIIKKYSDEEVIVPVDYQNTGVTLKNTIWSNGLHQFVQLKHNLHLTSESLTSSFISNIGYIKLYNHNIFGLTGTLGSIAEQKLLSTVYDVDYARIPTYKQKNFQEEEGIVVKDDQWINCIALDTIALASQGRSVLIICKTIKDLQYLEKNIEALKQIIGFKTLKVKTYPDEDSSQIVDEIINVSEVILATNIAGRGTDLRTSFKLEQNGGLHVCISFLPVNQRVEYQAFGRTSRQGNAGTAKLIIKESDVLEFGIEITPGMDFQTIKQKRDKIEMLRLDKIRDQDLKEIAFQDSIFSKFTNLYRRFKQKQMQTSGQIFVTKDLKEFWAFWLQKQNFKNFDLSKVQGAFEAFEQAARNILAGNITHNPFYSILQAEHFLSDNEIDQAKKALNYAIHLSKDHAELLYSAHLKLFEVSIESGNQLRERFKKALKEIIFIGDVKKNEAYKKEANTNLENAKKALQKEISYLENNFFGKEKAVQNCNANEQAIPSNFDFMQILTHDENNLLVKHIFSRITVLNVFYQRIENLLDQINGKETQQSGLAITTRIPNYLQKPETANDRKLKETITDAELSELGLIGLETIYAIREVHDVPIEVINRARVQICAGLNLLGIGSGSIIGMPVMGPIAGTLISEGICDIAIELISQGTAQFSERVYIKSKCTSYLIAAVTLGISSMLKSTTILDQATKACKGSSNMLKKCPVWQSLCKKIATQADKLEKYFKKLKAIQLYRLFETKQLNKLRKMQAAGKLELFRHLLGAEKSAQLQNLLAAPSGFQIFTNELVNIGKSTLQSVVGSIISEKIVTKGIDEALKRLKPTIEENVHSTIKRALTEEELKSIDPKLINEILIGSYGEIATDIFKDVALGLLNHINNWKAKLACTLIDTSISIHAIFCYTESFCRKLQEKIKQKNHDSQKNVHVNYDAVIESISKPVSEKIYEIIIHLVGKHARSFVVSPLMNKAWSLCEGAFKKKDLPEENSMYTFCEVINDLETLGLSTFDANPDLKCAHIGNIQNISSTEKVSIIIKSEETGEIVTIIGENFEDTVIVNYMPPQKGQPGHFSIPEEINKRLQNSDLQPSYQNNCLYDALVPQFHALGKNMSVEGLRKIAEKVTIPNIAYSCLMFISRILNNPLTRKIYYKVQNSLLVGGYRRLDKPHYPSFKNRIIADESQKEPIAAIHNVFNEILQKAEDYDKKSLKAKHRYQKNNISDRPCFGTVPDKNEMMIASLEAWFSDGTSFKVISISGDRVFGVRCDSNDPTVITKLFEFEYKGHKFVDCGAPKGNIYDVYNKQETTHKYIDCKYKNSRSCAAKKAMYFLGEHVKKTGLTIIGQIQMVESWYTPGKKAKYSSKQVKTMDSCSDCDRVLRIATGEQYCDGKPHP